MREAGLGRILSGENRGEAWLAEIVDDSDNHDVLHEDGKLESKSMGIEVEVII